MAVPTEVGIEKVMVQQLAEDVSIETLELEEQEVETEVAVQLEETVQLIVAKHQEVPDLQEHTMQTQLIQQ